MAKLIDLIDWVIIVLQPWMSNFMFKLTTVKIDAISLVGRDFICIVFIWMHAPLDKSSH